MPEEILLDIDRFMNRDSASAVSRSRCIVADVFGITAVFPVKVVATTRAESCSADLHGSRDDWEQYQDPRSRVAFPAPMPAIMYISRQSPTHSDAYFVI